jgi:hypothetical protein
MVEIEHEQHMVESLTVGGVIAMRPIGLSGEARLSRKPCRAGCFDE